MELEMAEAGFNIFFWGLVALLTSIANIMFNKKRKQWGTSAKFLYYSAVVLSAIAVILGLWTC
jgi:hypothetical protein